jgi:NADH-quinone oxidoreductase subunit I
MTNQYDRTVFELKDLNYEFSDMSPETAAEKRRLLENQLAERQAAKLAALNKKEGDA